MLHTFLEMSLTVDILLGIPANGLYLSQTGRRLCSLSDQRAVALLGHRCAFGTTDYGIVHRLRNVAHEAQALQTAIKHSFG